MTICWPRAGVAACPAAAWARASVIGAALLALAGCADMQGIHPTAQLTEPAALGLGADAATLAPAPQWWQGLGDAQLDGLVSQALAHNPSLQVAAARVAKARSAEQLAAAAALPQVSGALDLTRQAFSGNYIYPPPFGGSVQSLGNLQVSGGWELDFFGRNAAAVRAAVGQWRAAQAEADAARVLLATQVVRSYLQWARLGEQRRLAERALAQREQLLALARQRVQAGLDSQLAVRRSETGRAESRTQIAGLEQQIDASRRALAALLGQPQLPTDVQPPRLAQLRPLALPTQLHADWLGRRADIVAARWRVEAARGEVDVARAQFYPNLNLAAFVGLQSIGFDKLLQGDSLQWGVGPALRLPIFEGGRLRANLGARSAEADAAIASYNAAVIEAMREVADQAQAVQATARQQREQAQALLAAEGAWDIANQRYQAGLDTYLDVLSAETAVLAQRSQQADLLAQALGSQVGVAQAMGGGWQAAPSPPSPPSVPGATAAASPP